MRHLLLLCTLLLSYCQSFPLPAGQLIKYRVSSKYFNRPNGTSVATENSSSLYNLLTQIHYGDSSSSSNKAPETPANDEQVTTTASELFSLSNDNKNNENNDDGDVTTVTAINSIANESPGTTEAYDTAIVNDVDDVTTEQQDYNVDDEKSSSELDSATSTTAFSDDLVKNEEFQNLVDEKIETISSDKVAEEDEEENPKVPDSLLNAVGDLLSSVLGISLSDLKDDDDEEQQQQVAAEDNLPSLTTTTATEGDINEHEEVSEGEIVATAEVEDTVTSTNVDDEAAGASSDDDHNPTSEKAPVINEVDLKIENLANVQTSFVTENTPENYVDNTVKEQSELSDDTSETDDDKIVFETLSELSTIADDVRGGEQEQHEEIRKPVSFEDSVNHVMNLVRGTESKLALEAAQNIVDSVLIDSHMEDSVSDLDQIVYGTLKEIESNLGLNEANKNLPTDSFDPTEHEREEMIKSFETDINESLRNINPDDEDYESLAIEPNPAKAAMYYKFQYGDDF